MNPNYEYWLSYEGLDADTRRELESIAEDADEIEARFAVPMHFGTADRRAAWPLPTTAATTRCVLPRRRQRCWRATA